MPPAPSRSHLQPLFTTLLLRDGKVFLARWLSQDVAALLQMAQHQALQDALVRKPNQLLKQP